MVRKSLRSLRHSLGLVALLATLGGCGTTFVMEPDASVPFAKGEVAASFEQNGNGRMTVHVEHLGDAGKLNPSATTYVVWVTPKNAQGDAKPENKGALKVTTSYTGTLDFITPYTSFDITITPEPAVDVTAPTGRQILKATISAPVSGQKS